MTGQLIGTLAMAVLVVLYLFGRNHWPRIRAHADAAYLLIAGIIVLRLATAQLEVISQEAARTVNGWIAVAVLAGLLTWLWMRVGAWRQV